ncbi:MAG TPA: flagellar biosynthetic protein FliO [Steroidobacteraceae bacterium]|jgi:flagellar protein FliO/FliZ|nr:flagellar biosynthetic protein FliO [Steroidobacteraceae bacterium]
MSSISDNASAAAHSGAAAHVFAAPGAVSGVPVSGVAGIGQVTLALCIVLGAIFLCAWLMRRMRNLGSGRTGAVNVVAEVRLGPKERAVLLQVGTTQLLVGVAPGQISALHVLAEPLAAQPPAGQTLEGPSFKSLLRRSLGK